MSDPTLPPRRMPYSIESRCRAVQLMEEDVCPAEAAASIGASRATGYRWWARYRQHQWSEEFATLERWDGTRLILS